MGGSLALNASPSEGLCLLWKCEETWQGLEAWRLSATGLGWDWTGRTPECWPQCSHHLSVPGGWAPQGVPTLHGKEGQWWVSRAWDLPGSRGEQTQQGEMPRCAGPATGLRLRC